MSKSKTSIFKRLFTGVMVAALSLNIASVFVAPSASAAEAPTFPGAISNINVEKTDANCQKPVTTDWVKYESVCVTADWKVPDWAKAGDTFSMTLPSQLGRLTNEFPLTDSAGATYGTCVVNGAAAPVVTCTLSEIVNTRNNVSGSMWFFAYLDEVSNATEFTFDVNGSTIKVPVKPIKEPSTGTPTGPEAYVPVDFSKWSSLNDNGTMSWTINIPGEKFGEGDVTITDTLAPEDASSNTWGHHGVGSIAVYYRYTGLNEDGANTEWLPLKNTDGKTYFTGAWNADGKSFTMVIPKEIIKKNAGYRISYVTVPDGKAINGDQFTNAAKVSGVGEATKTQTWKVLGGGTGTGDIPKIDVTVNKIWKGGAAVKPDIKVQLYRDGKIPTDVENSGLATIKNGETKYVWKGLPQTDERGNLYEYTVDEVAVPENYEKTVQGNTITNTYVSPKTEFTVEKIWIGGSELKPTIQVQLYRNGEAFGDPITLTNGKTTYTWDDLDLTDENGVAYEYTVDEVDVPAFYLKSIDGSKITNTFFEPGKGSGGETPKETPSAKVPTALPVTGAGSISSVVMMFIIAALVYGTTYVFQFRRSEEQ